MIRFQCPHCRAKLKVPEERADKESVCPRCKKRLKVPPVPELELVREEPGDAPLPSKLLGQVANPPPSLPASKDKDTREDRLARRLLDALRPGPAREHTGERRHPWLIDILLYPASLSGLITLAALTVLPLSFAVFVLGGFFPDPYYFTPPGLVGLFALWYLAECVYDSAKGGTRAPEIYDPGTSWDDLLSRVLYLVAVYGLFLAPCVLYRILANGTDVIFWALAAWAIFFLPMGVLAMVIHDSASVLNPLFLLGSILRVLGPYVGLLLFIGALAGWFWYAIDPPGPYPAPVRFRLFTALAGGYAVFIAAHILGRFYWRYRERLDWGI